MRLKDLYPTLSHPERDHLASAAGIKPEYLYQLATGFRRSPSLRVFGSLLAADPRLTLADLGAEFCGIAVAGPVTAATPAVPSTPHRCPLAAEASATPSAPIPALPPCVPAL